MDILEKIFNSAHRAKIMKLFLFNPDTPFDVKSVISKVKSRERDVRKELLLLEKIQFLKKKSFRNSSQKKMNGFVLNTTFGYIEPIREFLIKVSAFNSQMLIKKISQTGRIKLIVVSGIFLQDFETRVDLLVVGDRIQKNIFDRMISGLEADMGREIHYATLETEDFKYRLGVGDKLVRDIFDYKHEVIYNKIGLVE